MRFMIRISNRHFFRPPPKALVTLEERSVHASMGINCRFTAPILKHVAILRSKADRAGYRLPDDLLETIARRVQSNIRELEGALTRIVAFSIWSGCL
jgi:chromosomal replication initiator protein